MIAHPTCQPYQDPQRGHQKRQKPKQRILKIPVAASRTKSNLPSTRVPDDPSPRARVGTSLRDHEPETVPANQLAPGGNPHSNTTNTTGTPAPHETAAMDNRANAQLDMNVSVEYHTEPPTRGSVG